MIGKPWLRAKATGEMLIRSRLDTFKAICNEYGIDMTVHRVSSVANWVDVLTRVPQKWLTSCDDAETS